MAPPPGSFSSIVLAETFDRQKLFASMKSHAWNFIAKFYIRLWNKLKFKQKKKQTIIEMNSGRWLRFNSAYAFLARYC